jgi:hypothetical protein
MCGCREFSASLFLVVAAPETKDGPACVKCRFTIIRKKRAATTSLTISEQTEARLTEAARRQGISLEALLERLISERAPGVTERKSKAPELPLWHVG